MDLETKRMYQNKIIDNVEFKDKNLANNLCLFNATLNNVTFENCTCKGIDFRSAKLKNCKFINCSFIKPDFGLKCNIEGSEFTNNTFDMMLGVDKTITKNNQFKDNICSAKIKDEEGQVKVITFPLEEEWN